MIFLLLIALWKPVDEFPPSARTVIVDQQTVHHSQHKAVRSAYEDWVGCSDIIEHQIGEYRHLVCVRTYMTEGGE